LAEQLKMRLPSLTTLFYRYHKPKGLFFQCVWGAMVVPRFVRSFITLPQVPGPVVTAIDKEGDTVSVFL
jgi:hypothetical protein